MGGLSNDCASVTLLRTYCGQCLLGCADVCSKGRPKRTVSIVPRTIGALPQRGSPALSGRAHVTVAGGIRAGTEQEIEYRKLVLEFPVQLPVLGVALIAHPFHRDIRGGEHGLIQIGLGRGSAEVAIGARCPRDRQETLRFGAVTGICGIAHDASAEPEETCDF